MGSWLGVFAVAMLFIGPPVGQWRAQQQSPAAGHGQLAPMAHSAHADHSAQGAAASHAGHRASEHADRAPRAHGAGHLRQVGALTLDHCGYCHLVASFAALPATLLPLPLLRWEAQAPRQAVYPQPASAPRHARRARAPPSFHV